MSTPPGMSQIEHLDVLIVGAGISGIAAGCSLSKRHPDKSFAILEARGATGGTWDLFRYPGIRSDSDLHTFGYEFKPWRNEKAIAGAAAILDYLHETVAENGIDHKIRLHHKVRSAAWSSDDGRWLVEIEQTDTGEQRTISCGWLFSASGYYRYDEGFTPQFEGRERFEGEIVHPQHWPEYLDYRDKRVVVIGSGATAVTLIPALAELCVVGAIQRQDCEQIAQAARREAGVRHHPAQEHRTATYDLPVLPGLSAYRAPADPLPHRQAIAEGLSRR